MDGVKVPLTFKIYKGEELLRTEILTQPVIKIGKLSSSHLRIDDETVSRMHAVIEVTGVGEISIIDLGSTKGTIVNGQRVNKARLQDGDQIVLGDTRLVMAVGEAQSVEDEPTTVASDPGSRVGAAVEAPVPPAPPASPPPSMAGSVPPPPSMPLPAPASRAALSSPALPSSPAQPAAPLHRAEGAAPFVPQFGLDASADQGGARAIEVAAMLMDSVVAVKHITSPRGGAVTSATKGVFLAGGLLLVMAMFAFGHAMGVAGENEYAFFQWVDVDKKAAVDFRPKRLNPGWDVMTFFGLGGAVILFTWGLTRLLEERRSPFFRIGRASNVEFPTENAPADSFPLVAPSGDDFVFNWAPGMKGEMSVQQGLGQGQWKTTPLEQLPQTMQIPHGARIRVETGVNTFIVSSVPAPQRHPVSFLSTLDDKFLAYQGGCTAAVLLLLLLMFQIPPDPRSLALDLLGNNERLNKVSVKPPEDPKQLEDLSKNKDNGEQSGGTGTKQANEEGKMGKKDSTRQSGQYAMKNNSVDPQLAKQQAIDKAQRSGILGALKASPGGAFASLTGTGDFSSGTDDRDVYGGLIGNEVGEMAGGWGYGISGTGPGGGGTGLGTIGTGRYGTIGHGSGTGSGYGVGSGRGGGRGRLATQPRVNIGTASATGDLDKNIIRRYIRQKLPQIEYCYEKQLVVKPSLKGTVTTQFTINGNGTVIQARASGIGDAAVENCVADTIRSIQFPKPTGGGIVNVVYPFIFQPAGE